MGYLMGLLMDHIMDRSMHRVIHLMGTGWQQPAYSLNYGFVAPNSQGTPHYGVSMPLYMGQMGGGYHGMAMVVMVIIPM